ncbi:MAG: F0F1 ATP synthase subunit delta, partial [Chryseobacterium sp.]
RQKRERHLEGIAEAYVEMVEQMRGVQRISLVSATPLSQQNIDEILKSSSLVDHSKSFEIDSTVKPEILGGYILRVGDQQMDASVRSKLNNIKKEFQLN